MVCPDISNVVDWTLTDTILGLELYSPYAVMYVYDVSIQLESQAYVYIIWVLRNAQCRDHVLDLDYKCSISRLKKVLNELCKLWLLLKLCLILMSVDCLIINTVFCHGIMHSVDWALNCIIVLSFAKVLQVVDGFFCLGLHIYSM